MRRALDPSWDCGLGFGTVKRTRSDLRLPWEGQTFGFIAADRCFLDNIQSALLAQPDPVPLPWPKQSKQPTQAPTRTLPQPKLRALSQWKPQDSQAERQAALSKWSQLLRAVPYFFQSEPVREIVHETCKVELGEPRLALCKEEYKHTTEQDQQPSAFCSLGHKGFSPPASE